MMKRSYRGEGGEEAARSKKTALGEGGREHIHAAAPQPRVGAVRALVANEGSGSNEYKAGSTLRSSIHGRGLMAAPARTAGLLRLLKAGCPAHWYSMSRDSIMYRPLKRTLATAWVKVC